MINPDGPDGQLIFSLDILSAEDTKLSSILHQQKIPGKLITSTEIVVYCKFMLGFPGGNLSYKPWLGLKLQGHGKPIYPFDIVLRANNTTLRS